MGKNPTDFESYVEDRIQAADNFNYAKGANQFKFGGDYNYLRDRTMWNLFFPARIIFPLMPRLLNFRPTTSPSPATGQVVFFLPTLECSPMSYEVLLNVLPWSLIHVYGYYANYTL